MATQKPTAPAADGIDVAEPAPTPEAARAARSMVERIEHEYGQWRAACPLEVDGVPAFYEGQPVPASHPRLPWWRENDMVVPITK